MIVGFVGIGNMGQPMTINLLRAGWKVVVFDSDVSKVEAFSKNHKVIVARSLTDLGRQSEVVITMLPDGHIVKSVLLGEGEESDCLVRGLNKDAVVIDMSSSGPVGTKQLGKMLLDHSISMLDAPVSGGVKGAIAGTLAIMIGGDRELAKRFDALLSAIGKRYYVGPLGSGHAAKALNNFVSAAGLAAAAEAVLIGERFGIDPQVLINVINASSGRNNSTENKFAQFIFNGKFDSGFSLGLMAKDIGLAMGVAEACNVTAPMGEATRSLWKDAENTIGSKADHTEVARYIAERSARK